MIDRIEYSVMRSHEYVEHAVVNTVSARKLQSSSRKVRGVVSFSSKVLSVDEPSKKQGRSTSFTYFLIIISS